MTIGTSVRWGLVAGMSCLCLQAQAASFDCKLARTPQEKAICATPALSAADERLAAAYKTELAAVPPAMQGTFREQQRQFLHVLAVGCAADRPQPLPKLAACMQPQVEARIDTLKHSVSRKGGVTFVIETITLLGKDSDSRTAVEGQEQNPGYGTVNVSWPQSLAGGPQWVAWNAAITRATQAMADPAGDKETPSGWQDEWAADQEATVSATVEHVDAAMVSSILGYDFMGHGAAHPGESTQNFHWLLAKGRELKVGDVFAAGSAWKSFLTQKCRAGLKAQARNGDGEQITYSNEDLTKALAEVVGVVSNWTFSKDGLTVEFPEYTVAPRVSQPQPVTISWTELKPYLAPGFTPPQ